MAVYLLSFSLHKPSYNYPNLYSSIEAISQSWCSLTESTWILKSNLSSYEISEKILNIIDKHLDTFIVVEVKNNKTGWLEKEVWEHLDTEIFKNFIEK